MMDWWQVSRYMAWRRACRALPVTATAAEIIALADEYMREGVPQKQ